MAEDIFEGIAEHLRKVNPETKPVKEVCMETARKQVESLGYLEQLQQMINRYGKEDTAGENYGRFDNVDDHIKSLPYAMTRISPEEARKLLAIACWGMPMETNKDGTVPITSLTIYERTTTTIQTKYPIPDKRSDLHFTPQKPATDALVRKFISDTGFVEQNQAGEIIRRLKSGEKISFQHPSNKFLIMTITGPKIPKKSRATDLYSYQVQTKLSPHPPTTNAGLILTSPLGSA